VSALAHFGTGLSLEHAGNADQALAEYLQAFRMDNSQASLAVGIARAYLRRQEPVKAIEVLEVASKANRSMPSLWMSLGLAYRAAGQITNAMAAFCEVQKLDPSQLDAAQSLLEIHLQKDALADAAKVLDQSWAGHSEDAMYWMRLGDLHAAAFREKSALEQRISRARIQQCYEKANALSADNTEVLVRLAESYAESGNPVLAAETYARILQVHPNAVQLRERLAGLFLLTGQKEKAAGLLEQIIKTDPLRFQIYNLLGNLYEDLNWNEKAISNYRQSIAVNADQLEPMLRLALLETQAKRFAEALKLLGQAGEKFPDVYQVPYFRALAYSDQKDFLNAVKAFETADTMAGKTPEEPQPDSAFFFYYGSVCERAGNLNKAAALFEKALNLNPENHAAANYLGYMWAEKAIRLQDAHQWIQKAVALQPDNGAYLDSLGWVLFKLDRPQEALPHLRRAADLIKGDAVVCEHLAEVLLKLGQREAAISQLRRAVEAAPSNKELAEKLQRLTVP